MEPFRLQSLRMGSGVEIPEEFPSHPAEFTVPAGTKATILLDNSVLTTGYPTVKFSGGAGAEIVIGYAEALYKEGSRSDKGDRDETEGKHFIGYADRTGKLVLTFDDIAYGQSLGTTAKAPRDSIAFKWADQTAETVLREIEWSASRTGLINPVAIFDPVELEGTTVTRASVHNVSIMEDLALGIGDRITVYKANMIIPQIAENLTKSGSAAPPESCPVCGERTRIKDENGVRTLWCENPGCLAKQIKSFTLFVSRDAMNIEGLSEATIEKLIAKGLVKEQADILRIEDCRDAIVEMEGFGEKSFANLVASVEKAKNTTPERLLYALGIPGIGVANAKTIASACGRKWTKMTALTKEELLEIDGIGDVLADGYVKFFADPEKAAGVRDIEALVTLDETEEERDDFFDGLTFVITGTLEFYENRDALKAEIEKAGGKVSGSVSSKTSYLVNNDITSTSGKNKKARELGIPVIDEKTVKSWLENKSVTA